MLVLDILNALAISLRLKVLNQENLVFISQVNDRGNDLEESLVDQSPRDLERQRKLKRKKRIVGGLLILIDM